MFEVFAFIIGAFAAMWVDTFWWHIDYKKAEKGFEWHEHYHIGLELSIVAIFANIYDSTLAAFLFGVGFLFMVAEWRQAIEVVGKKVIPGHPFAYGSVHFKSSTIIGIVLTIMAIISHLYLVKLLT